MPAAWTTPITWNVDQLVTNTDLNEQLRDNMEYLLSPNHDSILRDNSGDYSITGVTSFQDIDSSNLSIDLETHGGPVWVHFQATGVLDNDEVLSLDLAVDGTRLGAFFTHGLGRWLNPTGGVTLDLQVGFGLLLTGLSAGTYTLRPQWRTGSGDTVNLRASTAVSPVIFGAIEL
jgi:hypothetical protein